MKNKLLRFLNRVNYCYFFLIFCISCNDIDKQKTTEVLCGENQGFSWSVIAQNCIDLDKNCIVLRPIQAIEPIGVTKKAYILFDENMATVELFLPNEREGLMLQFKPNNSFLMWENGDFQLTAYEGYELRVNNRLAYYWHP